MCYEVLVLYSICHVFMPFRWVNAIFIFYHIINGYINIGKTPNGYFFFSMITCWLQNIYKWGNKVNNIVSPLDTFRNAIKYLS